MVVGPQRKFQCKLQAAKEQLNRLKTCKGVEQTFFVIIRWNDHEVSPLYIPRNTHLKEQKHRTINRYTPFMTPFIKTNNIFSTKNQPNPAETCEHSVGVILTAEPFNNARSVGCAPCLRFDRKSWEVDELKNSVMVNPRSCVLHVYKYI